MALVVEDNLDYSAYVQILLRRLGLHVAAVPDGEAALAFLRGGASCDLLILDYDMPKLNGLETIRAVRSEPRLANTYAIMLTAREGAEVEVEALESGMDEFLQKGASEREIVARVKSSLRLIARQKELDQANSNLYGLAMRDELTGVYNRRYFLDESERLLFSGEPLVSLILFDLDLFKDINDTFGHLAGDRVLADIGDSFRRNTRAQDFIARYGGDEFVSVVSGAEVAQVEEVAARMCEAAADLRWTACGETFGIGISSGIACRELMPEAGLAELLNICDRDLYKNKWMRKHPGEVFTENERTAGLASVSSLADFRRVTGPDAQVESKIKPGR